MKTLLFGSCALLCSAQLAMAVTLTNGQDDGSVEIEVNEVGGFSSALFNPVGDIEQGSTTFESFIAVDVDGGGPVSLGAYLGLEEGEFVEEDGAFEGPVVAVLAADANPEFGPIVKEQTETRYVTQFNVGDLQVTLTQSVSEGYSDGERTGSILNQEFEITNIGTSTVAFDAYRYFDGDIYLIDETLEDTGGVLGSGSGTVLYELDVLEGASSDETFVGITAVGGVAPTTSRYAVDFCCGINTPLSDSVEGDEDGDGRADSTYDVTLTLRNEMSIEAGETATYLTQTIFGTAEQVSVPVEPEAGSSELVPLLPTSEDGGSFDFVLTDFDLEDPNLVTETIWIDPVVAVGYTYTITGADFFSVTAPSAVTVPDADGYTLTVGGVDFVLAAGDTFFFGAGVQDFTITGIDAALMLSPTDTMAFPTGVSLTNFTQSSVTVTQTAIEFDTDPVAPAVPLPSSVLLLGGALAGLGLARRRR